MKRTILITGALLVFASTGIFAQKKSCDDLKMEIAAKLEAKGVKGYELKVVAAEDVKGETVVGTCEGGARKITYSRK